MKKLLICAAIAGVAMASCNGGKTENADTVDSITVVNIDTLVYLGNEKTVPGDVCAVEIRIAIAEEDTVGTYQRIQTYTYGQTGQQVRTAHSGKVTRGIGTKKDKEAVLYTCERDNSDKILYYEQALNADNAEIIIQLAEDKGRSANWKDYVYTKQ